MRQGRRVGFLERQLRKLPEALTNLWKTMEVGVGQKKSGRIFIHESGEAAQIDIGHPGDQGRLGAAKFSGKQKQ
jgi:hypothetical protein